MKPLVRNSEKSRKVCEALSKLAEDATSTSSIITILAIKGCIEQGNMPLSLYPAIGELFRGDKDNLITVLETVNETCELSALDPSFNKAVASMDGVSYRY